MKRCAWFIGFLVLNTTVLLRAQCIEPAFVLQSSACQNENIAISNTTIGDYSFEWDFCAGDLKSAPTGTDILNNTNFFRARSVRFIQDDGQWYAFAISATDNILMRLNFGVDIASVPIVTNLGNVGSVLSTAFAFDMVKESNVWHMLIANGSAKNIIRYSFTNGLTNAPQVSTLETPGVFETAGPNFIRIVKDGSSYFAFVSVGTSVATTKVIRISLGTTIANNAPSVSDFNVSGANQLRGMSFVKECDQWYGFGISFGTNALYRLHFGSDLSSTPTTSVLNTSGLLNQPVNIEIRNEGGKYFAFVQNARSEEVNAAIYRINFGESIANTGISTQKISLPQLTGGGYALDIVSTNSSWYAFTFNLTTRNLVRINFINTCSAQEPIVAEGNEDILVTYTTPGKYYITLKGSDTNENKEYKLDSVTITSQMAPDINFTSQNICVNHNVNFTSQNSSGDIVQYDWDFGDTNSSGEENPVHQYASNGEYNVELVVTAQNGCKNLARQSLTMFNEPVPDFTTPSVTPICTNQNFLFENISSVDPGYTPAWGWSVNGTSVSTDEDLYYTFANIANHEIKLKASIPGCESAMIKNINTLVEGPQTDFTVTGQCEDAGIDFTNTSSGGATEYTWDFGDGNSASTIETSHAYMDPGVYNVILTASNAAGCNNTISKPVTIYSTPQVNFAALLPPFSCSGTPTQFSNLTPNPTDSNIASWLWDFGDIGSSENTATIKNPQHMYSSAGNYNVSLMVSTNFMCSSTLQLPVTISQSPTASFNFTPTCKDIPVNFSDISTGNIQSWNWQIGSAFYFTQNPTHTFVNPVSTSAMLTVTATNNCMNTSSMPITVPARLTPDFSVSKNCAGENTMFTDITIDGSDPVNSRVWNFAALGVGNGSPSTFSFPSTGNFNVTLDVTTLTGCFYTRTKAVSIIAPPVASFNATPETGVPPLDVQFENTSLNGNSYLWKFDDTSNTTSTVPSPSFTFSDIANYNVSLITYNTFGCSDTTYRQITVSPITGLEHEGNFIFEPPYPNPSRGELYFNWTARQTTNLSVSFFDVFGRRIFESNFLSTSGANETIINLSGLTGGVYFLRIEGEKKMFRIVISPE